MTNIMLYGITIILAIISYKKDKKKTKMAFKKGWKSFKNIIFKMLGIITLIGIMLSILDPKTISNIIGGSSGWMGVILAGVVGSITMIPGFIAFPTGALLLENGAGYMQIGAFISTLMMVGVVTFPMEVEHFGKKVSILRNLFAFIFSFIVAFVIGKVV